MSRFFFSVALLSVWMFTGRAGAQNRQAPPETVPLITRDGVQIQLTYFPSSVRRGTALAKQVTPVVLLHDYKETRAIFNGLARRLQAASADEPGAPAFAVVTVDLRGHGNSTTQSYANGQTADIDAAKLRKEDYISMVTMDMAAVRSFLLSKNDEGELNLNKLCLVGSGMGASVAANWAMQDWRWPPLAIGKQGQDVKGLVLISPRWSFNGLSFQFPLRYRPLKENVAWMIVYGAEDRDVAADGRRIAKQLERFHPELEEGTKGTRSLQSVGLKSTLQGSTLVTQLAAPIEEQILAFLNEHVASRHFPWSNRLGRLPE